MALLLPAPAALRLAQPDTLLVQLPPLLDFQVGVLTCVCAQKKRKPAQRRDAFTYRYLPLY